MRQMLQLRLGKGHSRDFGSLSPGFLISVVFCWSICAQRTPPTTTLSADTVFADIGYRVILDGQFSGTPPLVYRWLLNGHQLPGATDSTLVIPEVQSANFGKYIVFATNAYGGCAATRQLVLSGTGGGSVTFNNRVYGAVISRVFGPEPDNPTLAKTGNTANDYPPGMVSYTGTPLAGSNYMAQLWSAMDADQPESALLPATPTTVFRTGIAAGYVQATTVQLPNVPKDYPIATLQLRVWDSREGTVTNWLQVLAQPTVPRGVSPRFNVTTIGGDLEVPANLIGLQSFNLFVPTNHVPQITAIPGPSKLAEHGFSLSVNGYAGAAYQIEVTTNLGTTWSDLAAITNLYGYVRFDDPIIVTNTTSRFYRVIRIF